MAKMRLGYRAGLLFSVLLHSAVIGAVFASVRLTAVSQQSPAEVQSVVVELLGMGAGGSGIPSGTVNGTGPGIEAQNGAAPQANGDSIPTGASLPPASPSARRPPLRPLSAREENSGKRRLISAPSPETADAAAKTAADAHAAVASRGQLAGAAADSASGNNELPLGSEQSMSGIWGFGSGNGTGNAGGSRGGSFRYQNLVAARIQRRLYYPEQARRQSLEGRAMVEVRLQQNGAVKELRITQSSGHQILDSAAEQIVQRAAPYPPFPEELTAAELDIVVPLNFRLKSGLQ